MHRFAIAISVIKIAVIKKNCLLGIFLSTLCNLPYFSLFNNLMNEGQ